MDTEWLGGVVPPTRSNENSSRMEKNGVKGTYLLVPRCGEGRGTAPLVAAHWCADPVRALVGSSGGRRQVAEADQVVRRQAEDEHPADPCSAPVARLAQQPHGL